MAALPVMSQSKGQFRPKNAVAELVPANSIVVAAKQRSAARPADADFAVLAAAYKVGRFAGRWKSALPPALGSRRDSHDGDSADGRCFSPGAPRGGGS